MIELGVSPVRSQYAKPVLKTITKLVIDKFDGVVRSGIAPKTGLELRIEQALRSMGAWR